MERLVTFLLLVAACDSGARPPPAQQPAPPAGWATSPTAPCLDGPPMCGWDRASVVQCQRGAWLYLQSCPGPARCAMAGNAPRCDTSQAQVTGAPCAPEGGYGCTPDRRSLTVCR